MSTSTIAADQSPDRDPPALLELLPLMIIYAVGFMSATYIPVWVSAAATRYAVPASAVGLIGSYELGVVAIATILTAALRRPGPTRVPLVIALILSIAFNILTATAPSIRLFTTALIVSAIANGFLLAEVNGRAAASAASTRVFSGQLFVMMCFAALFFATAPRLLTLLGSGAPFFYCAGAGLIALISVSKLPPLETGRHAGAAHRAFTLNAAGMFLLAAATLLFIALNVILPFLGPESARSGASLATYSSALSAGAFVNLAGPIIAERLLRIRASWTPVMTIGIAAMLLCAVLTTTIDSVIAFVIGIIFLPFFLLVVIPFYLGLLLESDPSGKLVAVSSAFFMIGTAIGPGLGGLALNAQGLSGLALVSILVPLVALLTTWTGVFQFSRSKPG